MLLAAQIDTRASRPIWVDVPARIGCPDEGALLTALRARLGRKRVRVGRALAKDPSLRLVARGARALTMVLRDGGSTIVERDVEVAEGECAALAHTLALIAESWLAAPPSSARAKSQEATPEQPRPTTDSDEKTVPPSAPAIVSARESAPTLNSGTNDAATPRETPARAADTHVPFPAVPAAVFIAHPDKGAALTSHEAPEAKVQPIVPAGFQNRPRSIAITTSAGAMVPLAGPNSWAAAGRLEVQLGYGRWFGGVRGAHESTTDLHPAVGNVVAGASTGTALPATATMTLRYTPVGAFAGRVVVDSNRFTIAALAGGGVDILSARASGYSSDSTHTAVDSMAFAGLRGEWRVSGQWGAVATSDVALDVHRYQFSVANVGPVARTPRARAGFALGVAWHLR